MKVHAIILTYSVDLPPQDKVLNMKQYNGKFACPIYKDEGVPTPRAPMIRNWPFNHSSIIILNSVKSNAQKAIEEGCAVSIVPSDMSVYIVLS